LGFPGDRATDSGREPSRSALSLKLALSRDQETDGLESAGEKAADADLQASKRARYAKPFGGPCAPAIPPSLPRPVIHSDGRIGRDTCFLAPPGKTKIRQKYAFIVVPPDCRKGRIAPIRRSLARRRLLAPLRKLCAYGAARYAQPDVAPR
jgi:hypothetical protein